MSIDQTIARFYGYTLENPGKGALKQLDSYLDTGHMRSSDGTFDYARHLNRIRTPTLMVAGEGGVLADIPSSLLTFEVARAAVTRLLRSGSVAWTARSTTMATATSSGAATRLTRFSRP